MLKFLTGALKSNTVQFNGGVAFLWLLDVLSGTDFIKGNPDFASVLTGVIALVNIILRFKTKKALKDR